MYRILFVVALVLCLAVQPGQAQDLTVEEMVFCTVIEDREPVDVDTMFSAGVDRVYCFTKITGALEETVTHVWYYENEEKSRIELMIGASPWRTWSYKTMVESWIGNWRVDVLSESGDILKSESFVIR